MDKQVTLNKIEQLISAINNRLIPTCANLSESTELGTIVLDLKALAIQIRQQIRKA